MGVDEESVRPSVKMVQGVRGVGKMKVKEYGMLHGERRMLELLDLIVHYY